MANNEIKLGLGDPPVPVYIFVREGEEGGEKFLWHTMDMETMTKIPITERALTGTVTNLKLLIKDYKGSKSNKLDVTVLADKKYIIRSAADTLFSRGLIAALETLTDEELKQPICIALKPGSEENVIFVSVYRTNGEVIMTPKLDKERKMFTPIVAMQARFRQTPQTVEDLNREFEEAKAKAQAKSGGR